MINIIGETHIHFDSTEISVELIQRRLNEIERYSINSHKINNTDHLLYISFIMNMKENKSFKSLDKYYDYAHMEFQRNFPSIVAVHDFTIHSINKVYKPITPIYQHMTILINNKLDNSNP